ncbi:MAG: lysylphosphatidylglycerol synthase transmembrane domain-containing protein [Candidatus Binatia bacterium]
MSAAARSPGARSRSWLRPLASLALTAILCFLLLRRVDVRELADWLLRVDPRYYAGYVGLAVAGLLARSWRYQILIGRWVGFWPIVLVTAARNFLVDLLPARIGSLSYVYLLTRRFGVPLEPVLSSFVLTFLYDLLAMTLLVGIALVLQLGRFESMIALGFITALLGVVVLAVFLEIGRVLRLVAGWLRGHGRGEALAARLEETAREVSRSGGRTTMSALLALSVAIRLLKFGAYWALLLGVVREHDLGASDLPFWTVFLGIAGAELSATLPIHGVAGFGTYETAWTLGFERLGLSSRVAILSGFATHLLSQIYDYSVGLVALALAMARSRRPG